MRSNHWVAGIVFILIFGALATYGRAQTIKQIEVRKWDVYKKNSKGVLVTNYDLITSRPISAELRKTAAEAELATLKRMNGEFKDIFDASFVRALKQPFYVVTDTSFSLPAGLPNFVRAKSMKELEGLAAKTKTDIYYVSMEVIGSSKIGSDRGVVIEYKNVAIDWERAQWNTLGKEERAKLKQPKFRGWEYGSWGKFCAIRKGSKIIFYEGELTIS